MLKGMNGEDFKLGWEKGGGLERLLDMVSVSQRTLILVTVGNTIRLFPPCLLSTTKKSSYDTVLVHSPAEV